MYTGFFHCFCYTNQGDLFGWGKGELFRLTEDYGEEPLKIPKLINLNTRVNMKKEDEKMDGEDKDNDNTNKMTDKLEERKILAVIYSNDSITSFQAILVIKNY